jgi:hypothetical protein
MKAALLKVRAHQNNTNERCRNRREDETTGGADMTAQKELS